MKIEARGAPEERIDEADEDDEEDDDAEKAEDASAEEATTVARFGTEEAEALANKSKLLTGAIFCCLTGLFSLADAATSG